MARQMKRLFGFLAALILSLHHFLLAQGSIAGTTIFVETGKHGYIRSSAQAQGIDTTFLSSDLGVALTVLLGVDPPTTMSRSLATKLDGLLSPNPFSRPGRIISVIVEMSEQDLFNDINLTQVLGTSRFQQRMLNIGLMEASTIPLEGDVKVTPLIDGCIGNCFEEELKYLVSIMDGSIDESIVTIPASDGTTLKFSLLQEADHNFLSKAVSFLHSLKLAVNGHKSPELLTFTFTSLEGIPNDEASKFVLMVVTRSLHSLEVNNNDGLMATVTFSKNRIETVMKDYRSSRFLEERALTDVLMDLSHSMLAVWTSIILIVAAFLSCYCLFNMPLTQDTLLYSGAKLD